jgi:hypothetical protein
MWRLGEYAISLFFDDIVILRLSKTFFFSLSVSSSVTLLRVNIKNLIKIKVSYELPKKWQIFEKESEES